MRVVVAAVGRLKQGPERDLTQRYLKRAGEVGRSLGLHPVDLVEIRESRNRDAEARKLEESIALANLIPERAAVVLLDEQGDSFSSAALAGRLQNWQAARRPAAALLIGGPDGLAASLSDRADLKLAFGAATWPHQLVRIMLLEQLYRATTILSGHPYHRG